MGSRSSELQRALRQALRARQAEKLEGELLRQIVWSGLPAPERGYRQAIPGRKLEMDFAWPAERLGVECNGGIFPDRRNRGRGQSSHASLRGMMRDYEKLNLAQLAGWRLLVVAEPHIRSGQALRWIEAALSEDKPG